MSAGQFKLEDHIKPKEALPRLVGGSSDLRVSQLLLADLLLWGHLVPCTPFLESLVRMKYTHVSLCSIRTAWLPAALPLPDITEDQNVQFPGKQNIPLGRRSLVGLWLWGCKAPDVTKQLTHTHTHTHTHTRYTEVHSERLLTGSESDIQLHEP